MLPLIVTMMQNWTLLRSGRGFAVFAQSKPSEEQRAALRLLLMYFDDHFRASSGEINNLVDRLVDRYQPDNMEAARPGEPHRAVNYLRRNASKGTLEKNYYLFLYALRIWLRGRPPGDVPAWLKPAMEVVGLAHRQAVDSYLIDRAFVESCYRRRSDMPELLARRVVEEYEGFWLVYRLSTPRAAGMPSGIPDEDRVINLSLLRIPGYSYLKTTDRLLPRFTFEFRGERDGSAQRPHGAEGYLVPVGERLFLIGRRRSHAIPTLTAISWLMPDIDPRESPQHATKIESLAYATNSEGEQVAFYFVAKFVRESANYRSGDAFVAAREVYRRLINAYPYRTLNRVVGEGYQRARKVAEEAIGKGGQKYALPEEEPPILEPSELRSLIEQSESDVVFKGR